MRLKIDGFTDRMVMCGDKKCGSCSQDLKGQQMQKNRIVEQFFLFEPPVLAQCFQKQNINKT